MKSFLFAATLACFATSSHAQEAGDATVALGLSTFGANLEAGYYTNPQWRVRGALMGGYSYSETDEDGLETTEVDVQLGAVALLADYYPVASGWRVSAGLLFSNSDIDALVTGDVEVNDVVYPGETLEISAEFENEIAPMITTGYDLAFGDGWSFNSELGLVMIGGIDLTATASNATIQDDIDNDADYQDAQDDAADLSILPYVGLNVSYQF